MKVFISWSGQKSKKVAELLDGWLQCVIQAVKPFISSKGIESGSLWFSEISKELADTSIGIVCLTNDNKNKPWILFESGALAKGLATSKVCTFLIDLTPADLQYPLAAFNHTGPSREGVLKLVTTINNALGNNSLQESKLLTVFDTFWSQFDSQFKDIITYDYGEGDFINRSPNDILNEVLLTVRQLDMRLINMEYAIDAKLVIEEQDLLPPTKAQMESISWAINRYLNMGLTPEKIINHLAYKISDQLMVKKEIERLLSIKNEQK